LGRRADSKALIGQDLTTEGVGGAAVAAVNQDAERVVHALPVTLPSQDRWAGRRAASAPAPPPLGDHLPLEEEFVAETNVLSPALQGIGPNQRQAIHNVHSSSRRSSSPTDARMARLDTSA